MKRFAAALATIAALWSTLAAGQAPPPVPALPDSSRLIQYSITGSTCACSVPFALYGDQTDVDEWLQVFVGSTAYLSTDPTFGWSLSSATGPIGSIPRPITNAVLTFNSAQTGTVTILGARRPRRLSQFSENRGVAARDLNQVITDEIAMLRERWDYGLRSIAGQPGEVLQLLPPAAIRPNTILGFNASGQPVLTTPTQGATTRTQRLAISSPITALGTDQIINVNITTGSPTFQLPLASTRGGVALSVKDVGGQFGSHSLTITPTSPDTIDGLTTITLSTSHQFLNFVPANDGTTTGWSIE